MLTLRIHCRLSVLNLADIFFLISELNFTSEKHAKDLIKQFANKLHRLAQESVIAFPRSASTVNNSPRFQEFLRIAVEK